VPCWGLFQDVVTIPELNAKCTVPWEYGVEPTCCTTDFTVDEIKRLCAKMAGHCGLDAETAEEYAFGCTPDWYVSFYYVDQMLSTFATHPRKI
jgi:glycerophosphoryl diester phosphodiesterase